MVKRTAKWGAALGTLAGGMGFGLLLRSSFRSLDALAKTSDKLGITIEKLQALHFAAGQSGIAIQTFNMALQRMLRRVAEAAKGTGEAKAALAELRLDARRMNFAAPDKQLRMIADALSRVETQSDRVRLAFKLFDSEGVSMINMLQRGSAVLDEYERQAHAMGIVFSRDAAQGVIKANDAVDRMRKTIRSAADAIAVHLAPWVERIANIVTGFTIKLKAADSRLRDHVISLIKWGAGLTAVLVILPKVVKAITLLAKAVRSLVAGQIFGFSLAGPKGWAILAGGIASASAALYAADKAMDAFSDSLTTGITEAEKLGREITEAGITANTSLKQIEDGMLDTAGAIGTTRGAIDELTTSMQRFAQQTRESIATPLEQYNEQLAKLRAVRAEGLIDWDEFFKAKDIALKEFRRASGFYEKIEDQIDRIREDAEARIADLNRLKDLEAVVALRTATREKERTAQAFFDPRQVAIGGVPIQRKIQKVEDVRMKELIAEIKTLREQLATGGSVAITS